MSDQANQELTSPGDGTAVTPTNASPRVAISDYLINSVAKGECFLFLGAMVSAPTPKDCRSPKDCPSARDCPTPEDCRSKNCPYVYDNAPPSGAELSRRLADKCTYPYTDIENLQRVSLYFEYAKGRGQLIQAMKEQISDPGFDPSPALKMLAALPFRIVITTNYDDLFESALWDSPALRNPRKKRPTVRVYRPGLNDPPEELPTEDPSEERPLLLKLHGSFDKPESIVVTEDDYLNFIQKMSLGDRVHPIDLNIRGQFTKWPILFIGYSLKDYNFRLLMRTLRWNVDPARWRTYYSVDPSPDGVIFLVSTREPRFRVDFIVADLWDFVPRLYEAVTGAPYA